MGLWPKPDRREGTAQTPYACAAIRAFKPAELDYESILFLIGGDVEAHTLAHVAKYFDVGLPTIKAWRQSGMPGTSGRYYVFDVLLWRIREDARGEHRKVSEIFCHHCEAERLSRRARTIASNN
jgi:hypothetical protein